MTKGSGLKLSKRATIVSEAIIDLQEAGNKTMSPDAILEVLNGDDKYADGKTVWTIAILRQAIEEIQGV